MRLERTALRSALIAAIAVTVFSLPIASVAQADQQAAYTAKQHAKKHVGRMHPMQTQSAAARREAYGAAPSVRPGCTWPYRNQEPPCMSTFPQGDPNYHGGRHGPLFDE